MAIAVLDTTDRERMQTSALPRERQDQVVQTQIENLLRATEDEIKIALGNSSKGSSTHFLLNEFLANPIIVRGAVEKKLDGEDGSRRTNLVASVMRKIGIPKGLSDDEHWYYRFATPSGKEHLFIDSKLGKIGQEETDQWQLFCDQVQVRKLDKIPARLVGLHQKLLQKAEKIESDDLRYVMRGIANQFLGIEVGKLAKGISVSETDIREHITKLNKILCEDDVAIHIRNGIAIIGGTDEAEPIFVIDSPDSRKTFFAQEQDVAVLFSGNVLEKSEPATERKTEPDPELLQKIKELTDKIAEQGERIKGLEQKLATSEKEKTSLEDQKRELEKRNAELAAEIVKLQAELEEARKPKPSAAPPPPKPPAPRPAPALVRAPEPHRPEDHIEINGTGYQVTTTEKLKDAAVKIAEFLLARQFRLNSMEGKPLQLYVEVLEKSGRIIIKSNIQNFPSNCNGYKGRMIFILKEHLKTETVALQLANF